MTELVTSMLGAKTSRSLDRTMAHFARDSMIYSDASFGWRLAGWDALRAAFGQYMPTWAPAARSYATRIVGDEHSAIVFFTNSPEMFGHEIRFVAAVDFRDGLVVRQVDYWDGRHFGVDAIGQVRTPAAEFPRTFGEDVVPEQSSPVLRETAARLRTALDRGDTTGLFTADAVFEDLALRTGIVGPSAIDAYVRRAFTALPYARGATIRHTVGSHRGGGYEWVNEGNAVDHGIIAIELDEDGLISRFTTTWDGALLDDAAMTALLATTLER